MMLNKLRTASTLKVQPQVVTSRAFQPRVQKRSLRVYALSKEEQDKLKIQAANKAVEYVKSGMRVGLGTGSTASFAVDRIAELMKNGTLKDIVAIPTSLITKKQAEGLGIPLKTLEELGGLDIAIDGADEVDPALNLVKGRGGALLREKIVESAAKLFICVVDDSKLVDGLGGSEAAMPVEVTQFEWEYNFKQLLELPELGGPTGHLRMDGDKPFVTDNSNYIIDLFFKAPGLKDPHAAAAAIKKIVGVIEHGLFMDMVNVTVVASAEGVKLMEKP